MTDANMFVERRAHPRFKLNIQAKCSLLEDKKEIESVIEEQKKEKFALTRDISLGGLGITSDLPIKEGDLLNIEMVLPGHSEPISAVAEVIWTIENKGGLHFLKISEENLEALKAYLHKVT